MKRSLFFATLSVISFMAHGGWDCPDDGNGNPAWPAGATACDATTTTGCWEERNFTSASQYLNANVCYSVYKASGYDGTGGDSHIIFMFHGIGGNPMGPTHWIDDLVEEAISHNALLGDTIIVIPAGDDDFYNNDGVKWADMFWYELKGNVESNYDVGTTKHYRFLAGFSMGGEGCARIAFERPGSYKAISCHSGAHGDSRAAKNSDGSYYWVNQQKSAIVSNGLNIRYVMGETDLAVDQWVFDHVEYWHDTIADSAIFNRYSEAYFKIVAGVDHSWRLTMEGDRVPAWNDATCSDGTSDDCPMVNGTFAYFGSFMQ